MTNTYNPTTNREADLEHVFRDLGEVCSISLQPSSVEGRSELWTVVYGRGSKWIGQGETLVDAISNSRLVPPVSRERMAVSA